jgi:hypothetical protein
VDGGDVRVVEGGEELRLPPEAGQTLRVTADLGGQDLDRHVAVEPGIGGPIDFTHAPRAEGLEDPVGAEGVSRRQSHVRPLS